MLAACDGTERFHFFRIVFQTIESGTIWQTQHEVTHLLGTVKGFELPGNSLSKDSCPGTGNHSILHILPHLLITPKRIQIIALASMQHQDHQQERKDSDYFFFFHLVPSLLRIRIPLQRTHMPIHDKKPCCGTDHFARINNAIFRSAH